MTDKPSKRRGRKPSPADTHRLPITVRLPQVIIAALNRAVDENATNLTDEVELRLVETLIADGLLDPSQYIVGANTLTVVLMRASSEENG